jgi:lysophospholipase L1-like esterase
MNHYIKLLALTIMVGGSLLAPTQGQNPASSSLQAGDFTVICGDSITEQKLYSVFIEDYLLMCRPAANLQAVQLGWGGEGALSFARRMKSDALPFKPTVATIFYGMNDGGYTASDPVRLKLFRDGMNSIVSTFKENGVRTIVAGTPGVVDADMFKRANSSAEIYNSTLAELGKISREIATEQNVIFADVHSLMLDVMAKTKAKYGNKYHLAGPDGVHPAANGHLVIAYAFLKALGCSGDIGTITFDFVANSATADPEQKILSAANGEIQVESTRYPFCFYGVDPANPGSTRGVLEFLPFNQDLNRYLLVVKNANNEKLKITWGNQSKIFPAAELAKGINLAAEFLDNPFSAKFAEVETAIRQQQTIETPYARINGQLALVAQSLPGEQLAFDQFKQNLISLDEKLRQQAVAAVTPLTHTIKVEAAN